MKVVILSCSIRHGRRSHNVALYIQKLVNEKYDHEVELFDLKKADFPLFHERLSHMENPKQEYQDFADLIDGCDVILVVCPEYNSSFPAAFKNAFDLLYKQYMDKVVGIFSVSYGNLGGAHVNQKLQLLFNKVKSHVIGPGVYVPKVADHFDEDGNTDTPWMIKQCEEYIERVFSKVK